MQVELLPSAACILHGVLLPSLPAAFMVRFSPACCMVCCLLALPEGCKVCCCPTLPAGCIVCCCQLCQCTVCCAATQHSQHAYTHRGSLGRLPRALCMSGAVSSWGNDTAGAAGGCDVPAEEHAAGLARAI
eukprot:363278-Chlamydomonas_euryale.AAC.6